MKLGDDKVIPVDIRVIAATNKDIKMMSQTNDFRTDLFYRLNVLNVRIPSLNERREDIPLLVRRFVREFANENKKEITITPAALKLLKGAHWEGNVRELRNISERLTVICDKEINSEDVRDVLQSEEADISATSSMKDRIQTALEKNNYNKTAAAEELGISRSTLWRYLNK